MIRGNAAFKHTSQSEKATGKQIREYQDLALVTRREQQILKKQLEDAKRQTADIAKMNEHLVSEKDNSVTSAKQTAAALNAQQELRENQLEEQFDDFQLKKNFYG